jgi:hypothetical protein
MPTAADVRQRKVALPARGAVAATGARVLDEDEQDDIIAELRRDSDFSAKVFRIAFSAISVAIAVGSLYVVLANGSSGALPNAIVPRAASASQSVVKLDAFISAALVMLQALKVARYRPEQLECPVDEATGKPDPEAFDPPARVGFGVVAQDGLVRGALAVACMGLLVVVAAGGFDPEVLDQRAVLTHVWPIVYHASARLCLGWMQEVEDGIAKIRGCRYHFKSA